MSAQPPQVRHGRTIAGASAVLLPFTAAGEIDWAGFDRHLERTASAGLTPAVNMDTGYGPVLAPQQRTAALAIAEAAGADFIAGAHVDDEPGARYDELALDRACAEIAGHGGMPIVFPSFGMAALDDDAYVEAHRRLASGLDRYLGFELGAMFHAAGTIRDATVFEALMEIPAMVGLKHSSLRRADEWARLVLRDERRPDFRLYTGNDLAIDMVVYGSDYLLGLSTFAPDVFAARDRAWAAGDEAGFWERNDLLQYLGQLAFRDPVPAYRHSAAMFLAATGQIDSDRAHSSCPLRPDSDRQLLADIAVRLDALR